MPGVSLRSFILAAEQYARQNTTTALAVCEAILLSKFKAGIVNGRTVLQATDEGFGTTWAVPAGLGEAEVMELAGKAVDWIKSRPDPSKPGLPRRITRLRVTFDRATL